MVLEISARPSLIEYGIFGEGYHISTYQKLESTIFSLMIGRHDGIRDPSPKIPYSIHTCKITYAVSKELNKVCYVLLSSFLVKVIQQFHCWPLFV